LICQGCELRFETPHLREHVCVVLPSLRCLWTEVFVEPGMGELMSHHGYDRPVGKLVHQVGVESDGMGPRLFPCDAIWGESFDTESCQPDDPWQGPSSLQPNVGAQPHRAT